MAVDLAFFVPETFFFEGCETVGDRFFSVEGPFLAGAFDFDFCRCYIFFDVFFSK